jgi:hypothetical protein
MERISTILLALVALLLGAVLFFQIRNDPTESLNTMRVELTNINKASTSGMAEIKNAISDGFTSTWKNNEKYLIVNLGDSDKQEDLTEIGVVKESIASGGLITITVPLIRIIEPSFDAKFSVSNSSGSFSVLPALMNWVGSYGWRLRSTAGIGGTTWVFAKTVQ